MLVQNSARTCVHIVYVLQYALKRLKNYFVKCFGMSKTRLTFWNLWINVIEEF
jgi:hypothetical protein